jgi:hypothetical protein
MIPGQHVVIQGIELRTTSGSVLHYDFVPGFARDNRELNTSWGIGTVSDDLGTEYDHQGAGGWGSHSDGIVYWGDEDLGNGIPGAASRIEIEFYPANGWTPGSWTSKLVLELPSGKILNTQQAESG